jgi:hypothetical protein
MPFPLSYSEPAIPRANSWTELEPLRQFRSPISPGLNFCEKSSLTPPAELRSRIPTHRARVMVTSEAAQSFSAAHSGLLSGDSPSHPSLVGQPQKKRHFFKRIIMAPFDFLDTSLKKWLKPTDDCMRCVRLTYWVVLIVGGIITTAIAIAPFL